MIWIARVDDQVQIGRLGSFKAGTLSFAFSGDTVTITDDVKGRPLAVAPYSDLRDADGDPLGTTTETFDYLTEALAAPEVPDLLATYLAARDT